ncbi:L-aspartate oxidase [Sulfuricaulis limicola]|uniref:L-aspartate oxidase n=1 Tax=Sulfuricaulis limicola TaxID=1620215 RepID=A0A1B4XGA6_9GAMM|nr:L-aspartate oxidase [Sulfuricaulis limicola]BAV33836.1 L-aspartate oxidase [Sulfuricaulis limicola]
MTTAPPSDVLIIGGGIAGLSLALRVADRARVTILAKAALTEGSSLYAQGGVAAVLNGEEDSFESHIQDTLDAGAGLCHRDTVEFAVREGPAAIRWLIERGVPFSREEHPHNGLEYHLTREGGHSHRRVIHAADATGRAMETTLEAQVRRHPNITLHENHIAIDLITSQKLGHPGPNRVLGAYALNKADGHIRAYGARFVVLATGGACKAYLYTSNPDTSTGDGIAMAWRAGCRVANMEFVQFHPTCLYHIRAKSFLISEAVRGEGGKLTLPNGKPFMQDHDPRGELAPRDIVARAIDYEMKRGGLDYVHLDISHKPADFIKSHFPTIYERCKEYGYDITREPIPVVPAAHYTCGGVVTDLSARTDLERLYAVGECTFTGLHGANRLASNSLLECLVFAKAAAEDILKQFPSAGPVPEGLPAWDESRVTDPDEQVVVSHNWDELRRGMWSYVGIVRTSKRLQRALRRVELLKEEVREFYSNFKVTNDLIELRNLLLVSELIIRSALARKESRGLHFTRDYPQALAGTPQDTVLTPAPPETSGRRANA